MLQEEDTDAPAIFTGEEELFAFDRVKSRLMKMQTTKYLKEREILLEKKRKEGKQKEKKAAKKSAA